MHSLRELEEFHLMKLRLKDFLIGNFFGILVYMVYVDTLKPRIRAKYSYFDAIFYIDTLEVENGFPEEGKRIILEWIKKNKKVLKANWNRGKNNKKYKKVPPADYVIYD